MEVCTSVSGLRLKFAGSPALQFEDLSVELYSGQKVLLLGPSGCGKSTLLQVLTGLIPQAIEVPMKCDDIQIPASWGYVFQDPDTQFCMPFADEEIAFVLENLGVPREAMRELIQQCLHEVGLPFEEPHVPIASMSQGMKQRLAIASVLALQPEVLFLDEPTSLLDPEGTRAVWDTIKKVGQHKTIIIVEHKIDEIIDFVDRVLLFNAEGEIIADGAPEPIFAEYKTELRRYGIWYPGVWADYTESVASTMLTQRQQDLESKLLPARDTIRDLAVLKDFVGYQGRREVKITAAHVAIEAGEWITVVGYNGAGKSTLLQALMQLIPTSGSYTLKGKQVHSFKDVKDTVAYVFQNPEMQFVANSVLDEAAFGYRADGQPDPVGRAEALLAEFGLQGKLQLHPYQLSLGQKRRLSVATAMVKQQQMLLLDEPTFGQDAANTFAILEKLENWRRQGTTIVMVTHDLEVVRHFATRVWLVEQGVLAADIHPDVYLRDTEAVGSSLG
ncbi:ABC transporter ATP-binding protein [Paenibacillus agricola]|uniref:ABC transporter ATP-binding protein n=1 Tax=Paenibacillus agricola TaxID=2716264 RepID=A0ABX0J1W8_9BACL|nr:ABC transporter ATP-binding protein [Paenibacillus agricola]NHN30239.1 ABC transporter ATP-binding protein [Paenibacillus agricola]